MGDIDDEARLLGALEADMRESQRQREVLFKKTEEVGGQVSALATMVEQQGLQLKALGAKLDTLTAPKSRPALLVTTAAVIGSLSPQAWDGLLRLFGRGA